MASITSSLREKCPNMEFFLVHIRTGKNSTFEHVSCNPYKCLLRIKIWLHGYWVTIKNRQTSYNFSRDNLNMDVKRTAQKVKLSVKDFLVNMSKSTENCGYVHIY